MLCVLVDYIVLTCLVWVFIRSPCVYLFYCKIIDIDIIDIVSTYLFHYRTSSSVFLACSVFVNYMRSFEYSGFMYNKSVI